MSDNPRHIIQRYYVSPTASGGSGFWSMKEQQQAIGGGNWPFLASIEIAVVGGGQGGAVNNYPGSGGAGGYFADYLPAPISNTVFRTTYVVTIGAGGIAAATNNTPGTSGGTSSVVGGSISVSAAGGLDAGTFVTQSGPYTGANTYGGAGAGGNGTASAGGPGTSALSTVTSEIAAGGGTVYGELSGGLYYYGGGGANPVATTRGVGYGAPFTAPTPTNAPANSGGGGAGGGNTTAVYSASNGGSGVVIIKSPFVAQAITASYSLTVYRNRYYYTITSSGSITF